MKEVKGFDTHLLKNGFHRINLLNQSSPLLFLKSLSKELDTPIYIKRDDLTEIGTGGNKLRKLEYLLAEAKNQNANRVITIGARQSNHARLTAITGKMLGFEVDLILKNSVPMDTESYQLNGNLVLDNIVDANIHEIPNDGTASNFILSLTRHYETEGDRVYFIPVGGSNIVGGLGYARSVYEIEEQSKNLGVDFQHIALASGSGGTHAGLIAGYEILGKKVFIQAYNVQPDREPILGETKKITEGILEIFGISANPDYHLSNDYVGEAYGIPNKETLATIKHLAKSEGVFLDPVYTAKAFTGLINDIKLGKYPKGEPILFIHTGGVTGLFAYSNWF
ncbi:D-cysteine desulfhydrase family protein [Sphingobacterium cellulitidis]|uniref:D-cysteine desulfhydrase family protein n=1 Tax=Sphingobacterium cellulitidis TaxID=1768011 RepID=UPI000B9408A6|nr:hypothetical protein CHT99_06850 [Sphingobacterium cellulitidis]